MRTQASRATRLPRKFSLAVRSQVTHKAHFWQSSIGFFDPMSSP